MTTIDKMAKAAWNSTHVNSDWEDLAQYTRDEVIAVTRGTLRYLAENPSEEGAQAGADWMCGGCRCHDDGGCRDSLEQTARAVSRAYLMAIVEEK